VDAARSHQVTRSFDEQLRGAGLRATQTRISVLDTLSRIGGHPSADELVKAVRAGGAEIARATVFNVLEDLARTGLVTVADAGPGAVRYEVAADSHHHFVCRVCGSISDVACIEEPERCIGAGGVDGRVESAQIIFRGVCASCLDEAG
jgi:Fe2+ or Zn2+ uptake regulation protein